MNSLFKYYFVISSIVMLICSSICSSRGSIYTRVFTVTQTQWWNSTSFCHQVENVSLEIPFPKSVLNVSATPSQGKYTFDPVTKVMMWEVGKIDTTKLPNLNGSLNLITGMPVPDSNPAIHVSNHQTIHRYLNYFYKNYFLLYLYLHTLDHQQVAH